MVTLGDDFSDLLIALCEQEVDFLLIGGWALALYGHGRGTDDLDVWVRATPENAQRTYRALVKFGAPVHLHKISPADFERARYGYRFGRKPQLVEVLTSISGVEFEEAWPHRRHFTLESHEIPYIGRAQLRANKLASARPKDLADVAWLDAHPE